MRQYRWLVLGVVVMLSLGCSRTFWGGAATGVLGAGAGYEIHADRAMKQLDEDFKNGKISQSEYDIRKDQIKRDSLLK